MEDKKTKRYLIKLSLALISSLVLISACRKRTMIPPAKGAHPYASLRNSLWLPDWRMQKSLQSAFESLGYGCVNIVSPFWYEIDNDGKLKSKPGSDGISIPDKNSINKLKIRGTILIPTITTTLMPEAFIEMYRDPNQQLGFTRIIKQEILENGYDGIDLDFEYIALTTDVKIAMQVREIYTRLCQRLAAELTTLNKSLIITVMPRWSDKFEVWRDKLIPAVYDYRALSAFASLLRIMAYDQHAPNTSPGPIAGFEWVKGICQWTRDNVCETGRVEIGIPLYGRDWGGGKVKSVLYENVIQLKEKYPGRITRYDPYQKEENFFYTDEQGENHTVWYSNNQSVKDRLNLLQKYGFCGGAFWAASYENPLLWKEISIKKTGSES